ncbi:MAG: cytochrome c oxidase subunit II [Nitrospirae bacterium]|nr:cytochrome c oxidase subunit II [Nitrospirota bacterium]
MFKTASSIIGKDVDSTFLIVVGVCILMLCIITFLTAFFIIRYRRSRNRTATDIPGNIILETAWTVIPVFIVLSLFYFGWNDYKKRTQVPADAINVSVTAQQWSWSFEYEGNIKSKILKLPKGRPVKLLLASNDVIHSLYIPAFRVKEDVVPGLRDNYLWFTPDEVGKYNLFCAEYCGLGHSRMLTTVEVMDESAFNKWREDMMAEVSMSANLSSAELGLRLSSEKGCTGCHSVDGTKRIGPSWKGLYLKKETVITDGKEVVVVVDKEYIRKSMLEPAADVVKGFPPIMPSQKGLLTDKEIEALIEYIKTL